MIGYGHQQHGFARVVDGQKERKYTCQRGGHQNPVTYGDAQETLGSDISTTATGIARYEGGRIFQRTGVASQASTRIGRRGTRRSHFFQHSGRRCIVLAKDAQGIHASKHRRLQKRAGQAWIIVGVDGRPTGVPKRHQQESDEGGWARGRPKSRLGSPRRK